MWHELHHGQTLAEAWLSGLVPHVRCLRGKRNGPAKIEACGYTTPLSLETLIWTRGARFPCWRLSNRLKCPCCGGTAVEIDWQDQVSPVDRARKSFYECERAVRLR
jgi:hypothetical protein